MKKIGIIYGNEKSFPQELIERINNKTAKDTAEAISIDVVKNLDTSDYDVIFDRISYKIPFYNSYLKLALLDGTKIVNNPFWNCADNNIFQSAMATKVGLPTPRTVVLPSKELPYETNHDTFHNLKYPLSWDEVFDYIKFPAFLKPNFGHATTTTFKVYNQKEFFSAYDLTGKTTMVLQEVMQFDNYYKCYIIARKDILILGYDPGKPLHMRFNRELLDRKSHVYKLLTPICEKVEKLFGFDFNSIDFGIINGIPYAIDLVNPTPLADKEYIGNDNFEWLIEHTTDYLLTLQANKKPQSKDFTLMNLIFGNSNKSTKISKPKITSEQITETDAPKKRGRPKKNP